MPIPEQHKTWFQQVCTEAGLEDVATACNESAIVIDGVPFFFVEASSDGSQIAALAVVEFLPKEGASRVVRRALELQYMMLGTAPIVFGIEPRSHALVYSTLVSPGAAPPDAMVIMLRLIAQAVELWRETLNAPGTININSLQKKMAEMAGRENAQ